MDGERFNFLQSGWGRTMSSALGRFSPLHTIQVAAMLQLSWAPGPRSGKGDKVNMVRTKSKPRRASQVSSRIPFHFLLPSKCGHVWRVKREAACDTCVDFGDSDTFPNSNSNFSQFKLWSGTLPHRTDTQTQQHVVSKGCRRRNDFSVRSNVFVQKYAL